MCHFKKTTYVMKKIGTYILIAIFLLIGLKSCIMTVISIKDYILIERTDEHGQQDRVILTPKYEMIYVKKYQESVQIGIYKVQGQEATHYISGIYCVGTFPFGLRYYNKPENVFDAQLTLTKKHGDSFPNIGDSFNATIVIYRDNVEIGKHKYKRLKINDKERIEIENMINQLKSL
jgi:hypothetical protein